MKPEAPLIFAGHEFTGRRLFESAMRNAENRERGSRPAWAVAKDLFAVGSTVAAAMCRDMGIDPDRVVKRGERIRP